MLRLGHFLWLLRMYVLESSSSSSKGTLYTITRVSSNDRRLFEYDTLASSFGPSRSVSWSKMSGEGYLAKALYHFSRDIGCLRHSLRFCAPDVIASTITRMYYRGESGKWHFVSENIFGIHASSSSEIRSQMKDFWLCEWKKDHQIKRQSTRTYGTVQQINRS